MYQGLLGARHDYREQTTKLQTIRRQHFHNLIALPITPSTHVRMAEPSSFPNATILDFSISM